MKLDGYGLENALLRNYDKNKKRKNATVTLGRFIAGNSRVVKYVFAAIVKQIFMANKFSSRYTIEPKVLSLLKNCSL